VLIDLSLTYYLFELWSIQVESSELIKFHALYGSLLKASMTATLRKRDKKREKARAEEAAKRKKKMTEPVKLEEGQSHKRGKGRRQHQRKIKALLKQQEAQKKHKEREEVALKANAGVVV
jgi:signal recognition particle subunit SRP14